MTRTALVTGITGQDGSFLAELLLEQGYAVTGMVRGGVDGLSQGLKQGAKRELMQESQQGLMQGPQRRLPQRSLDAPPDVPLGCSEHLRERLTLIGGDLLDPASLRAAIVRSEPQEIYHLAAPSFVPDSWRAPEQTLRAIAGATGALLEGVREMDATVRVYVAASGAMFGDAGTSPQREDTPCRPATPYAVAKLAAHQLVGAMRAQEGLWACSGIVFNHESERRPPQFVTRRITRGAAEIALGRRTELTVGDLQAVRDWSFAGDIMRGAWLMLQQERPADYVLASGAARTVGELARVAFACVGLDAERHLRVDPALVRAPETTPSVGDPSRARAQLGWEPRVSFEELVQRMVRADVEALEGCG
jgi:GDPmannose 4,6-dehydratase